MYASYWGLQRTPFVRPVGRDGFVLTMQHEEALARLSFVVEQNRRVAVMTGPAGCGKSLLLNLFAGQLERTQRRAVVIDLAGIGPAQLHEELTAGLRLGGRTPAGGWSCWRAIVDSLDGCSRSGIQTVLLFDNLDRAETGCRQIVEQLSSLNPDSPLPVVVVAVVRHSTRQTAAWLDAMIDLVVELHPLNESETASFVIELLARAGRRSEVFTSEALRVLHEVSGGIPGRICRLADLCLLAGMGRDQSFVDAGLVRAAAEELISLPQPLPGEELQSTGPLGHATAG